MKNETVSAVYAAALLDLALEKGEAERVHDEVQAIGKLLREDPDFRIFVESPKIERSEKLRTLETALRGKVADALVNFIGLVVQKGRALHLNQMLSDYLELHDQRAGIVHAVAVSAVPLSDTSRAQLAETLGSKLSKRIVLENKVDPEILGGLVVRYEGKVADGSLRTAIQKIGAGMAAIKLGSQLVHEN